MPNVRMPNGVVILNVPEGMTRGELLAKLQRNGYDTKAMMAPPAPPPPVEEPKKDEGPKRPGFFGSLYEQATILPRLSAAAARYAANPDDPAARRAFIEAADMGTESVGGFGKGENWEAFKETVGGSLGSIIAPAAAATGAAAVSGPAAFVTAPAAGYATNTAQYTIQNLLRQAQEQEAAIQAGKAPTETSVGKAVLAGGASAGLDVATGKLLGPLMKAVPGVRNMLTPGQAKSAAEAIVKASQQGTLKYAEGIARGVVGNTAFEVPQEMAQTALERWQAGLDLGDEEARSEYGQAAIGAVILGGPLGGVSGAVKVNRARALAAQERAAAEAPPAFTPVTDEEGTPVPSVAEAIATNEEALRDREVRGQELFNTLIEQGVPLAEARAQYQAFVSAGEQPATEPPAAPSAGPIDGGAISGVSPAGVGGGAAPPAPSAGRVEPGRVASTPVPTPVAPAGTDAGRGALEEPSQEAIRAALKDVDATFARDPEYFREQYGVDSLTEDQRMATALSLAQAPNQSPLDTLEAVLEADTRAEPTVDVSAPVPEAAAPKAVKGSKTKVQAPAPVPKAERIAPAPSLVSAVEQAAEASAPAAEGITTPQEGAVMNPSDVTATQETPPVFEAPSEGPPTTVAQTATTEGKGKPQPAPAAGVRPEFTPEDTAVAARAIDDTFAQNGEELRSQYGIDELTAEQRTRAAEALAFRPSQSPLSIIKNVLDYERAAQPVAAQEATPEAVPEATPVLSKEDKEKLNRVLAAQMARDDGLPVITQRAANNAKGHTVQFNDGTTATLTKGKSAGEATPWTVTDGVVGESIDITAPDLKSALKKLPGAVLDIRYLFQDRVQPRRASPAAKYDVDEGSWREAIKNITDIPKKAQKRSVASRETIDATTEMGRPQEGAGAITPQQRKEQEFSQYVALAAHKGQITSADVARIKDILRVEIDPDLMLAYENARADYKATREAAVQAFLEKNNLADAAVALAEPKKRRASSEETEARAVAQEAVEKALKARKPTAEETAAKRAVEKAERVIDAYRETALARAKRELSRARGAVTATNKEIERKFQRGEITKAERDVARMQKLPSKPIQPVAYRRGEGTQGAGLTVDDIEAQLAGAFQRVRGAAPPVVVKSARSLPADLRAQLRTDGVKRPRGITTADGVVYIVADNHATKEDAVATFYHETLGHLGLAKQFGKRLDSVLETIYRGNTAVRAEADAWRAANPSAYAADPNPLARAVEEVLAERSAAGVVQAPVMQRLKAVLKDFARRMGLNLKVSDAEVHAILAMAHDRYRRSAPSASATNKANAARDERRKIEKKVMATNSPDTLADAAGDLYRMAPTNDWAINLAKSAWDTVETKSKGLFIQGLSTSDIIRMAGDRIPKLKTVMRIMDDMGRLRNQLLRHVSKKVEKWDAFNKKYGAKGNDFLANALHMSTLTGVNTSKYATAADFAQQDAEYIKATSDLAAARAANDTKAIRVAKGKVTARMADIKSAYDMYDRLVGHTGEDGRKIYKMALDAYQEMFDLHQSLLLEQVDKSPLPAAEKTRLRASIIKQFQDANAKSVYVPLRRYGDYYIKAGDLFLTFESMWARDREVLRVKQYLKDVGSNVEVMKGTLPKDRSARVAEADETTRAIFDILDNAQSGGITSQAAIDAIKDSAYQLYLATLPTASIKQYYQHRKGVAGFDNDVLRNFVVRQHASVNQLSRLAYTRDLRNAMEEAEKSTAGMPNREDLNLFVTEMQERVKQEVSPDLANPLTQAIDNVAQGINQTVFMFMMTSVKSALIQMVQVPTVAGPVLASRYNSADAIKTLGRYGFLFNKLGPIRKNASGTPSVNFMDADYINANLMNSPYLNKLKKTNPELHEGLTYALNYAEDHDLFMSTYAFDLTRRGRQATKTFENPLMRSTRFMGDFMTGAFHHMERINRNMVYGAAFELEFKKQRKNGVSVDVAKRKAAEVAKDLLFESMFDYSSFNKPRYFKHPIARIPLQFASYSLQMTSYLARNGINLINSVRKKDPELGRQATIQLFGTMGMVSMFAGVTGGIPFYSLLMGAIDALRELFRDEDDPLYDEDVNGNPLGKRSTDLWFRQYIQRMFGSESAFAERFGIPPEIADDIAKGITVGPISVATGVNLYGSTSLSDLWFKADIRADTPREEAMEAFWNYALGPAGSLYLQVAEGIDEMQNGYFQRGVEKLLPAFVRGAFKAARLASEGETSKRGDVLANEDTEFTSEYYTTGKLLLQSLGFADLDASLVQRDNSRAKKLENQLKKEKQKLYNRAFLARTRYENNPSEANEREYDAVLEKIDEFNDRNWFMRIGADDLQTSYTTRKRINERSATGVRFEKDLEGYATELVQ